MYLAVILSINIFLFMGQTAVDSVANSTQFYNYDNSFISTFDKGNYTLRDANGSLLPDPAQSVDPDTGNVFTDMFSTFKSWITQATGVQYLLNLLNAVPTFLLAIGLPPMFAYLVGVFWHGTTLLLLIAFLRGISG